MSLRPPTAELPCLLEVCAYNAQAATVALLNGARRIELCSSPAEGGVTPSLGSIRLVARAAKGSVRVLIRPRGGNFVYGSAEVRIMCDDARQAMWAGCEGVVVGALTAGGRIDVAVLRKIRKAIGPGRITFHRAFDVCTMPPLDALQCLSDEGVDAVLTSGRAVTAVEGLATLQQLAEAGSAVAVLAGGGVRARHLATLQAAGLRHFHTSAAVPTRLVPDGALGPIHSTEPDPDEVRLMHRLLYHRPE